MLDKTTLDLDDDPDDPDDVLDITHITRFPRGFWVRASQTADEHHPWNWVLGWLYIELHWDDAATPDDAAFEAKHLIDNGEAERLLAEYGQRIQSHLAGKEGDGEGFSWLPPQMDPWEREGSKGNSF